MKWQQITNNKVVLRNVEGYKIKFSRKVYQKRKPIVRFSSEKELNNVKLAIQSLIDKGAIENCKYTKMQFLSSYFLVPKRQGSFRFILNLKELNEFIEDQHFKLEDIRTASKLVTTGSFMAHIDLQDAYYLIPMHKDSRKYLRFEFLGTLYQFTCLPFGLCTSPRIFTKLLRPVMESLRKQGWKSVMYLDDILCIADSFEGCLENVKNTVLVLESLGFIINRDKSILVPATRCRFLGFIIDTTKFSLELPKDKKESLLQLVNSFYKMKNCRIVKFAHLIGKLVAACPAIEYGGLYIKYLEREKIRALSIAGGNYKRKMIIPRSIFSDLDWWRVSLSSTVFRTIKRDSFDLVIFSDASDTGWGATDGKRKIYGFWNEKQKSLHINYKELLAVKYALESLASGKQYYRILLRVDNTTAISYVNKMGSVRFSKFNKLAREIWQWAEKRKNLLWAAYIPSEENKEADELSRIKNEDTEWELADWAFSEIIRSFGKPEVDLFASFFNRKCDKFCSRFPAAEALAVDAFTISWRSLDFYAFPPFAMILKTLVKIKRDKATGILIVPRWPSQPWFPLFMELLVDKPIVFKPNNWLLLSSCRKRSHPQARYITLMAGRVSDRLF